MLIEKVFYRAQVKATAGHHTRSLSPVKGRWGNS
jgi:hypothetical protein